MRRVMSFDVETTGLDPFQGDEIFAYCIGRVEGDEIIVDIHRIDTDPQARRRGLDILQKFFNDTTIEKVGHNIKFDLKFVRAAGVTIPDDTIIHDTMIMSQLLNNLAPSHSLKDLAWRYRGIHRDVEKDVKRIAQARGGYHRVPDHIMRKYQVQDGENTLLLFHLWEPIFRADPLLWEDYRNEMDLILETIRMEEFGLRLDFAEVKKLITWMEEELHSIQKFCLSTFGEVPNLNTSEQVNYFLYRKLKLPILEYTDNLAPSSDKDVLLKLRETNPHPFIDCVLKQRSYTKGIAMLEGYLKHADANFIIHPNIKTNEARTGRQASEKPNLQNVSKSEALKNPFPVPLRRVFRAHKGHVMPLVDYAAIELRLIVDRSEEEELIKCLQVGDDPHKLISSVWYGDWVRPAMRWSSADPALRKILRGSGKNANFAVPYGAALPKVATTLGLSIEETIPGYKEVKSRWPRFGHFTAISAKKVIETGAIHTAFGRKLRVQRDAAYAGANYDIQGTAAGILKRAQVRIGRYLRKECPEVRMVMPIHDELIFAYPRHLLRYQEEILRRVSHIMVDMKEIRVPLEVEWKMTTTTWESARELKLAH